MGKAAEAGNDVAMPNRVRQIRWRLIGAAHSQSISALGQHQSSLAKFQRVMSAGVVKAQHARSTEADVVVLMMILEGVVMAPCEVG